MRRGPRRQGAGTRRRGFHAEEEAGPGLAARPDRGTHQQASPNQAKHDTGHGRGSHRQVGLRMEAARAIEILRRLADGIDVDTGEPLSPSDQYNRPDAIRALFAGVKALEERGSTKPPQKASPGQAASGWRQVDGPGAGPPRGVLPERKRHRLARRDPRKEQGSDPLQAAQAGTGRYARRRGS